MTGAKEEERQEKTCELQESMSLNWVRRKIEGLDRWNTSTYRRRSAIGSTPGPTRRRRRGETWNQGLHDIWRQRRSTDGEVKDFTHW